MKLQVENRKVQETRAYMFYAGLSVLVTAVIWTGFSVYSQLTMSKVDTSINKLIKPINPSLDVDFVTSFANDRLTLPERFLVKAVIEENKQKTVKEIDPFISESESVPTEVNE